MTRHLKSGIIPSLCKYSEETEVPSLFALWSGVVAVAAVLGRSCCIDFGHQTIYPNLYVVLVAGSAKCRKSTAVTFSNLLLREVVPPVNMLSQKMTPEALIESLAGQSKVDVDRVIMQAEGVAIADELTTLIDRNASKSGLINLLTNLYDCGDFEYRTRGKGTESIKNPCLTLYGGSTLAWIKESLNVSAITGGFTARIVFVYVEKRERDIPWPFITPPNIIRWNNIIKDLCKVAKLRGPFDVTPEAKKRFEKEYLFFSNNSSLLHNPLTSGYAGRRHVILLKIAMAMSASNSDDMEITADDMEVSIKALEAIEKELPRIMRTITSTEVGDICQFVIDIITNKRIITRAELLKATNHKITAGQLDDIMSGICQTGNVICDNRGGKIIYVLKD